MRPKISDEERNAMVDMYLAGLEIKEIIHRTGRSEGVVRRAVNEYKDTHAVPTNYIDYGKIRALHEAHIRGKADWPIDKIALEIGCTEDIVVKALREMGY